MTLCVNVIFAIIMSLNPSMKEERAMRFADPICSESLKNGIDPLLTVSIIQHESSWKVQTKMSNKNGSTDYGVMQFNCRKNLDEIYLKWRKWWCDPSRRDYLQSIEGGIKAGVRELVFWRDLCSKKHKDSILYRNNLIYLKLFLMRYNLYNVLYNLINLSDLGGLVPYNYLISPNASDLKKILKNHWWVQHYNWNSKFYSRRVLYIYLAIHKNRDAIYDIVRKRKYVRFELDRCLQEDDLCLEEYENG